MHLMLMCVLGGAPEQLHEATRALDDLQYQAALDKLPPEQSIAHWERVELTEYFSTRALSLLGLKREAEAGETFRKLFTFAPEWALPEQYGPRVRTFVASARSQATRAGTVSLRFEGGLVRATKDAFGFGKELHLSWREPDGPVQEATLPFAESQPAPWPRDKKVEVWGRVLGLEGSTLFEWGSEHAPLRIEPLQVMTVEVNAPAPSRGLGTPGVVGIIAGAAGLVAGGVGTGFALASQDAERALAGASRDSAGRITSLTQRDAFALDARVSGDAGVATGLFISAAALVAVGVGLVIFDRVTVTPAPGGAVLTVPLDSSFAFAGITR